GKPFVGSRGVDGERVHAAAELGGERGVDHAVALQPALPPERLRHDIQAEMSLAARPVTGMAFVLVGFVDYPKAFQSESFGQLSCDEVAKPHGLGLSARIWPVNGRFYPRPEHNEGDSGLRHDTKADPCPFNRLRVTVSVSHNR